MNRKILLLNLALAALIALFGWQLRQRRLEDQAQERAVLLKAARQQALLAPPPPPAVAAVAPAQYLDTVQQMLFSKDRNPNVIIDVPPPPAPPPPPPPMPPLPLYFGQIRFGGDPVVILSGAAGKEQKGYAAGEKIGDFKVVSFDAESITFEWNGKPVERKLAELEPKQPVATALSGPPPTAGAGINPPVQGPPLQAAPSSSITSIGSSAPSNNAPTQFGDALPNGHYTCKSGDQSPIGSVVAGYRKSTYSSIMGPVCTWEPVKQ